MTKYVYDFSEGNKDMKDLLGGKGANLAEMTNMGLPVPPGFTITTEACLVFLNRGGAPPEMLQEAGEHLRLLEEAMGRELGDPDDPLLVSVRSGAKFSMPGMMDTVLNLGLNDESVQGLAKQTGDERFAYDSYRRFVSMYGRIVLGVPGEEFEERFEAAKAGSGATSDADIPASALADRVDNSGTGVGFTRDPATGEAGAYGDFLVNAQGEDVVAGIRNTLKLAEMQRLFPSIYDELLGIFDRLERHYRDMCDTEFTIDQGKLWMLQTRVGKRGGVAALRMAVDMTTDDRMMLTPAEAVQRVTAEHLEQVLHPQVGGGDVQVIATGLAASPGAGVGKAYFTADGAADAAGRGEAVILVRNETSPEDVHGMIVAKGILTARGGLVSHAAVVARGWGTPAVVGADGVHIRGNSFEAGGVTVTEGDMISVDGSTGRVMLGAVEVTVSEPPPEFETILGWADEIRAGKMAVRANADTGADAANARRFGAEGIGLCRTEHMFLAEDRLPIVRRMILAETDEAEAAALEELRVAQKADFYEVLEAMDGLPVTIRLLDPPLHEFLPRTEELMIKQAKTGSLTDQERSLLKAAESWHEFNPMLGVRGVRLGVIKPGLYAMQVRALMEAAADRVAAGGTPIVEIMIPLTVGREEMALARGWVESAVEGVSSGVDVTIGTMIETPRAALRAGEIAEVADFFSFGTNDLTQMTFGFSRDDVESRLMPAYLGQGLLKRNPFETIDAA